MKTKVFSVTIGCHFCGSTMMTPVNASPLRSDVSIGLSVQENKDVALSGNPELLLYILSTFRLHARSSERGENERAPDYFPPSGGNMWARWVCLDERTPYETELSAWAEANGLASWVSMISYVRIEPHIRWEAGKSSRCLTSDVVQAKPSLHYCFDGGHRLMIKACAEQQQPLTEAPKMDALLQPSALHGANIGFVLSLKEQILNLSVGFSAKWSTGTGVPSQLLRQILTTPVIQNSPGGDRWRP